ncbi:hypothetical protein [Pseudomonas sp. CGJS7]|uniref:hypothetical protein n=1 Tax=Pseudomonas sp. CGJS7 TaxID=3109348 RepID=UPI00300B7E17
MKHIEIPYPAESEFPQSVAEILSFDPSTLSGKTEEDERRIMDAISAANAALHQHAEMVRESILADNGRWSELLEIAARAGAGDIVTDYLNLLDFVDHLRNGFIGSLRMLMASSIAMYQLEEATTMRRMESSEQKARAAKSKKSSQAMLKIREEFFRWEAGDAEYRGMSSERFIVEMLTRFSDVKSGGSIRNKRGEWRRQFAARNAQKEKK